MKYAGDVGEGLGGVLYDDIVNGVLWNCFWRGTRLKHERGKVLS